MGSGEFLWKEARVWVVALAIIIIYILVTT